jgi:pyruvate/2-oxoglutarate dehydrogenase complex dihydrolipoamide acyltransferase (E2) component
MIFRIVDKIKGGDRNDCFLNNGECAIVSIGLKERIPAIDLFDFLAGRPTVSESFENGDYITIDLTVDGRNVDGKDVARYFNTVKVIIEDCPDQIDKSLE